MTSPSSSVAIKDSQRVFAAVPVVIGLFLRLLFERHADLYRVHRYSGCFRNLPPCRSNYLPEFARGLASRLRLALQRRSRSRQPVFGPLLGEASGRTRAFIEPNIPGLV